MAVENFSFLLSQGHCLTGANLQDWATDLHVHMIVLPIN